jgi:hypothetical protein
MSRFFTLFLFALVAIPAAAAVDPTPGADRLAVAPSAGDVIIAWAPVVEPGETVVYTVLGRIGNGTWSELAKTTNVYTTVADTYDEYMVSASVGGETREVDICVSISLFPPEDGNYVQLRRCNVRLFGVGQGL